ncbi:MAG: VRR-NUC domain-containing protein, partial [Pseudomonadota bacterium]
NGGHRHIAVASKLKAEGVKAGIPDLFLPVPRGELHGLYIEMKAQGGKVSPAQKAMMKALKGQGYGCIVAYTWNQAFETIKEYLSEEVIASYT